MRRLGLNHADYRTYLRTLRTTHERRIIVEVLNLDGDTLSYLTPEVLDGEVTVDVTREPTRILTLTFLDASRSIHFEPDSPGDAPLHRKRMIRVTYSVRVPALGEWVDCEVFTGIIWDFDRVGAVVSITADGKERQALGNKWKPVTYSKKQKKTFAIKDLMAETGETALAVPNMAATMPERLTITRMDAIWPRVKKLAASMDRQLFYDGRGVLVMRRLPSRPSFTFDERHLLSEVSIDRDPEGVFNIFEAIGAKPKGSKTRVRAVEKLAFHHPLASNSEHGIGRNGKDHYLVKREENRQIKTLAEARARAERMRDDASRVIVNYSFDSLPIPHLDENDLVRVVCGEGTLLVRMQRWTLPLGWEGAPAMSVGDVKRTTRSHSRRYGADRVG